MAAFSAKYQGLLADGSYIRLPGILYFVEFYAMPSILRVKRANMLSSPEVSRPRFLSRIRPLDASLHFANEMSKYAKLTGGEPAMHFAKLTFFEPHLSFGCQPAFCE